MDNSQQAVIIIGLVTPNGVSRWDYAKPTEWEARIYFEVWRSEDGLLHRKRLNARKKGYDAALADCMKRIKPYSVIRLKLHLEEFVHDAGGEIIEILDENDPDPELNQLASELLKPVTFEHERFGTFTLDRRFRCYITKTAWYGQRIELRFRVIEQEYLKDALECADLLWSDDIDWNEIVMDSIVNDLFEYRHRAFMGPNDQALSEEEFIGHMSLYRIEISPNGDASFWFNVYKELFKGYKVVVEGWIYNSTFEAKTRKYED